nr:acyltransferase [Sphingomonas bacterium]
MQRGASERHFGMDWLRIGAFQLLILYHVGMAFVPWDYHVKVASLDWVSIPMQLTSPWRLSLLFVVSGYASAALLGRSAGAGAFLRQRMARLGLPLLFGMIVVVPPQPWVQLVTQHGYEAGFASFLAHDYFRFRTIAGIAMPGWMHLWFVAYLIAYTLVLGLGHALPARWREMLRRGGERLFAGPQILIVGIAFVWWTRIRLIPGWEDTHNLVDDWSAHAHYLGMFLFGVLLRGSAPMMRTIARWWKLAALLAIGGYLVLAGLEYRHPGPAPLPPAMRPLLWAARAVESWAAIVALIGLADRYANRDHRWRATLAEAVFPCYLVHQTIILLVGYWLRGSAIGLLAQFLILIAATLAGCWLFYLAGRRIEPLRPLIGLKRLPGPGAARLRPATA